MPMARDIWSGKEHFLRDKPSKPIKPSVKLAELKGINFLNLLKNRFMIIVLIVILLAFLMIPKCQERPEKVEEEIPEDNLSEYRNLTAAELLRILQQEEGFEERHPLREIDIMAEKYYFEPNEIRVTYNDFVRLRVKSMDIEHDIRIPAYFISEKIKAENHTTIEFIANKPGEFVFDSLANENMKGKLIVEEEIIEE